MLRSVRIGSRSKRQTGARLPLNLEPEDIAIEAECATEIRYPEPYPAWVRVYGEASRVGRPLGRERRIHIWI
jgi:hypothetical protein